jgi:hypothetical protein
LLATGVNIEDGAELTPETCRTIVDWAMDGRWAYAWVGIIPKSVAEIYEPRRKGSKKSPQRLAPRPKDERKFAHAVLERLGFKVRIRRCNSKRRRYLIDRSAEPQIRVHAENWVRFQQAREAPQQDSIYKRKWESGALDLPPDPHFETEQPRPTAPKAMVPHATIIALASRPDLEGKEQPQKWIELKQAVLEKAAEHGDSLEALEMAAVELDKCRDRIMADYAGRLSLGETEALRGVVQWGVGMDVLHEVQW